MVIMHPDHGAIGASDSDLRQLAKFMSKKEYEFLKEAPQRLRDRGHRLSAEDVRMPDVFRVQGCENEHVVLMELKRWMVDYNFWWHDETGQIAEDELYKKGYASLSVHEYLKMTKQKQLVYCYGKALKVLREWQDIENKKELQLELDAAPASYAPVPCGQPLEFGFNDATLSPFQLVGDTYDGIPANTLEEMNDGASVLETTPGPRTAADREEPESSPKRRRTDSASGPIPHTLQYGTDQLGSG